MNESERIDYLIIALESDNAKSFATRCGIHPSSLSKIRNGQFHLSRFTDKILRAYPQVNPDWLRFGTGDPIKQKLSEREISAKLDDIEKKVDKLIVMMGKCRENG